MAYIAGVNRPVDTGDTYFNEIDKQVISGHVVAHKKLQRDFLRQLPVAGGNELEARIEHARWIVDCPNCNNAEFYHEDKLFFCSQCNNVALDGKTIKVKLPQKRKEIETLLGKRLIKNRHWFPNETLEDLEKENLKMGVI